VAFLKSLPLDGTQQIFIDETKLRDINSKDKDFNQKEISYTLSRELNAADEKEAGDQEQAVMEVEQIKAFRVDKVATLLNKKEKCEELLGKCRRLGQREIAFTDY
jgi:hypothetical protein